MSHKLYFLYMCFSIWIGEVRHQHRWSYNKKWLYWNDEDCNSPTTTPVERKNILILFHCIKLPKLHLWNRQLMKTGLNLWNHGRLPRKWYENQLLRCTWYFGTWVITWIVYIMQEACQKNKENRAKVKFPATTGSCSYPVFVENLVS